MLHGHGIFGPMSKFKKNKKIKDTAGHGFWACLTITHVRHGGHDRSKTKKKKKKRRKSQDFDIWTTPHRLSCLINGMRDRREGEKGNTLGKGEQYKGKVLAFYDWAIKAAIEVYHSRSLLIPINK